MKKCVFCEKEMASGFVVCGECVERLNGRKSGCRHKKENGLCTSIESDIFYQVCGRDPEECQEAE